MVWSMDGGSVWGWRFVLMNGRVWNHACPLDLLQEVQIAAEQGFQGKASNLLWLWGKAASPADLRNQIKHGPFPVKALIDW